MTTKKFTKPSQRKMVFHKKSGKWVDKEEEAGLLDLQRIKREQAAKEFQEINAAVNKHLDEQEQMNDEPHEGEE